MKREQQAGWRGLFLKVRGAYMREVASEEGIDRAIDAVNVHDYGQGQLICMTEPRFDDGTVTSDIMALAELVKAARR